MASPEVSPSSSPFSPLLCGLLSTVIHTTAGGYDALWLLVFDPADCPPTELPSHRVEALWGAWTGLRASPLSAVESTGRGVRVEEIDAVPGLRAAIGA